MLDRLRLVIGLSVAASLIHTSGCATMKQLVPPWSRSADIPAEATAKMGDELPLGKTVQACLTTAEQLAKDGHANEAAKLYEKARGLDPGASDYARRLAPLYDMQGDVARAKSEFTAALQAAPTDPDLLNDFGCFHDRQGNHAEAERLLRLALTAKPQHARAQINLGITLAHQGRHQEAFDCFAPVVGPAAAHSNVGMLLAKQGRQAEALQAINQALALQPNLPQARAAVEFLRKNLVPPPVISSAPALVSSR